MILECFRSIGCWISTCQMEIGEWVVIFFFSCSKSLKITKSPNSQEHQVILGCFRSIGCWISTCQMDWWVGCALVFFFKISKNYNVCKFTRVPSDSGILPLNWLLDNHLPNGNWWVGCDLLLFLFKISKNYNFCKFTRAQSDSGMLPLNLFSNKILQSQ